MIIVYIFEKVEVNFLKLKDHLELALRRPNSKLRISGKNDYEAMFLKFKVITFECFENVSISKFCYKCC